MNTRGRPVIEKKRVSLRDVCESPNSVGLEMRRTVIHSTTGSVSRACLDWK